MDTLTSPVSPSYLACGAAALGGAYIVYKGVNHYLKSDEQKLWEEHFCLERSDAVYLNHGSFGTIPKCIVKLQQQMRDEMERHPDRWFRTVAQKKFTRSVEAVANLVGAPADCVTLVENASTGINSVLRSMKLGEDDEVLTTGWTYQAVKNTTDFLETFGMFKSCRINLQFPVESEDDLVARFTAELDAHPNIRVCILDHITSPTAVVLPVKRLTEVLHSRNIRVIVDGAHAPGQLPLNMVNLGVDYYTGNMHKWCFTPRGCAFLYAQRQHHDEVMPLVISWRWKERFSDRFEFLGTRDQTALFTVPESLKFIDDVLHGQEAMVRRNSALVDRAADMLAARWGTERMAIPQHMEAPNMRCIRLPMTGLVPDPDGLIMEIFHNYNIIVATFGIDDKPYCRISANVYNEFKDYEKLADSVLLMAAEKRRATA